MRRLKVSLFRAGLCIGASVTVALALGVYLSSDTLQRFDASATTRVDIKNLQTQPVLSERFDDAEALKRFSVGSPDLGFEAGSPESPPWSVKEGALVGHNAHNATLWLNEPLPAGDVRISFRATAQSAEGDVKVEVFGDGRHHQSGYILINGGWKNTLRIIARQDEHGEDRRVDRRCGERRRCAPQGRSMLWTIERRIHADGGATITWYLDGALALRHHDARPLNGRHLGFGCWSAEVSFDDLKVTSIVD